MPLDYRKLAVYHLAHKFVLEIYKLTKNFPDDESKNLTSQLRRAVISIPLNIAEGSSRRSKKEFLQFLNYGFGSGKEIEVILALCRDLEYLTNEEYSGISKQLDTVMSKLYLFIRSVEERIPGTKINYVSRLKRDSGDL